MAIIDRVKVRKPEIKDDLLKELIQTATDRITLRVEEEALPKQLESVAVDIVCAMYNRSFHEGVKSENVDTFSISFVDNILEEFAGDFSAFLEAKKNKENENRGVVRFL